MRSAILLAGVLTLMIFSACSHEDPFVIPDGYTAYPTRYVYEQGDPWGYLSYTADHKPKSFLLGTLTMNFDYSAAGKETGLWISNPSTKGNSYYTYVFTPGPDGLPVSGTRQYVPIPSVIGQTIIDDQILYRSVNGKITEVRFFNRVITDTYNPNIGVPTSVVRVNDTVALYNISYQGDNISKIHAEDKVASKVTDHDFTYGTGKGPFYDILTRNVTVPDQMILFGYQFFNFYTKNELLSYKITDGATKTAWNYTYNWNKYNYPETAIAIDAGNSNNRLVTRFAYNSQ